jgi:pteridine reductase
MMAINLDAPFFLTQALVPLLRAAPSASVVNVTDVATDKPYAEYAHYMVTKAGLDMLTRALALELAPEVRVNAVAPGAVAFPPDFDAAKQARLLAHVPLGRAGSPDDVARAVLFLARDAPYMTGQVVSVDGGFSIA